MGCTWGPLTFRTKSNYIGYYENFVSHHTPRVGSNVTVACLIRHPLIYIWGVSQLVSVRWQLMFVQGQVYRRRDLHDQYGGQQQGGISTPANHPIILLFTGKSGQQNGYADE